MNADAASANLQTMGAYGAPVAALALIGPKQSPLQYWRAGLIMGERF